MDAQDAMLTARRALMGLGHLQTSGAADADHPLEEHEAAAGADRGTLDVRIVAIFAIAAGALLCGLPPLFLRAFQSPDAPFARIARAFAGGIILALALVHIIPEAVMELSEIVDFPIGGVAVLVGILALVIMDSSLTALWAPKDYKEQLRAGVASGSGSSGGGAATVKALRSACGHGHSHGSSGGGGGGKPQAAAAAAAHQRELHAHAGGDAHTHADDQGSHDHGHSHHSNHHNDSGDDAAEKGAVSAKDLISAAEEGAAAHAPHTHSCTSSLTAQRWLGSAGALGNVKQRVTAYTMELGCIFHSIIIGVGVGVITSERQLVIVLMVALIVHQGLEGMSLGTVLALTHFRLAKKVAMVVLYSLTTSAGIAIGIAASATYDHDGVTSKAVQGTLNGVSGGMLLYISMYQLIAEEFSREDLVVKARLRLGMIGGLLMGAACMCVLAIWS